MASITGGEEMFRGFRLERGVVDLINKSPSLVDQLLKYNRDVVRKEVNPIRVDDNASGIFWDHKSSEITFGKYGDVALDKMDP